MAAALQSALQAELDQRESIASLPDDEPSKTTDPARANEFWDDGDVVSRTTVALVWWDGGKYVARMQSVG